MTPTALGALIKKRWLIVLASSALFGLSTAVWVSVTPNVYEGQATLRLDLSSAMATSEGIIGMPMFIADPFQTQITVIKSRAVMEGVVRALRLEAVFTQQPEGGSLTVTDVAVPEGFVPEVATLTGEGDEWTLEGALGSARVKLGAPTTYGPCTLVVRAVGAPRGTASLLLRDRTAAATVLSYRVSASLVGPTEIIRLRLRASAPDSAALLANTLARVYESFLIESRQRAGKTLAKFLGNQLNSMKSDLDTLDDQIVAFQRANRLFDLTEQGKALVENLGEMDAKATTIASILELYRKSYPGIDTLASPFYADTTQYFSYDLATLVAKRAELASRLTEEHPQMKNFNAYVKSYKAELALANFSRLTTQFRSLQTERAKMERELLNFPDKAAELMRYERKRKALETVFSGLLDGIERARIEGLKGVGMATVVDSALPNRDPVLPRKRFSVILGLMAGLMFGLLVSLVPEVTNPKINKWNAPELPVLWDFGASGASKLFPDLNALLVDLRDRPSPLGAPAPPPEGSGAGKALGAFVVGSKTVVVTTELDDESVALAKRVGGVAFVVEHFSTPLSRVQDAQETLERMGVAVRGVVLAKR